MGDPCIVTCPICDSPYDMRDHEQIHSGDHAPWLCRDALRAEVKHLKGTAKYYLEECCVLRADLARLQNTMRLIKAAHTRWYMGEGGASEAMVEIEHLAFLAMNPPAAEAPSENKHEPSVLMHTCTNTATTIDGRSPPPCKACAIAYVQIQSEKTSELGAKFRAIVDAVESDGPLTANVLASGVPATPDDVFGATKCTSCGRHGFLDESGKPCNLRQPGGERCLGRFRVVRPTR